MFERPLLLWLLLATPLVALPALLAVRRGRVGRRPRRRGAAGARLRRAGVRAERLRNSNPHRFAPGRDGRADRSVALDRARSATVDARQGSRAGACRRPAAISLRCSASGVTCGCSRRWAIRACSQCRRFRQIPSATDIGEALTAADSLFSPEADKRILLLSDGNQTLGDAAAEIPALVENQRPGFFRRAAGLRHPARRADRLRGARRGARQSALHLSYSRSKAKRRVRSKSISNC